MYSPKKFPSCIFLFLFLFNYALHGQQMRFVGNYPLAVPSDNIDDIKVEFVHTLTAMLGGSRIALMKTTPSKNNKDNVFTKDDYRKSLGDMNAYLYELTEKLGIEKEKLLNKIGKAFESHKYEIAIKHLIDLGAKDGAESESVFFIWNAYISDIRENTPWTKPENIAITKFYRDILQYVSLNFERPFELDAAQGEILADAAQALSNCLEFPQKISWKGEPQISMTAGDELRRLASNVAYYNWRIHDKELGKSAADISVEAVRHLHKALYDIVRSKLSNKEDWDSDPAHADNLLLLFEDTKKHGWYVNGNRAQKR